MPIHELYHHQDEGVQTLLQIHSTEDHPTLV